ncbi:MAG: 6-bladed beta-propeller [Candidatus Aminicenantes bacterium]|nr:6-bladed beta-propeller [Candidatus Aminicenantes bacterium]
MRRFCYLTIVLVFILGFCGKKSTFVPTEKLPVLKLTLVSDFSTNEDLGIVGDAIITSKEEIFFFDIQKRVLYKANIKGKEVIQIGSKGEGPGEYTSIHSLIAEKDRIYASEDKGKIMTFSTDGKFIREQKVKTTLRLVKFLGKIDGKFVLQSLTMKNNIEPYISLYTWEENKEPNLLLEYPVTAKTTKKEANGRIMFQIIFLSFPVYAVIDKKIFASASHSYKFSFFDISGKKISEVIMDAPKPERIPYYKNSSIFKDVDFYSVLNAGTCRDKLCVISSYFRDNHPRLDVFTRQGKYLKSYIIPLDYKRPILFSIKFQGDYLVYLTSEESGFKVYKLPEKI